MKKIYLIALVVCMPAYGMHQQPTEKKQGTMQTSTLSPAVKEKFKSGYKAMQEMRWWPAIADLNVVFEFAPDDYPNLKSSTAILLGKAYTMVREPDMAQYFFNFAANQDDNARAKKYALEHRLPPFTLTSKPLSPPKKSPEGSPVKEIQIAPQQKTPNGSPIKETQSTTQRDSPVKRSLFKRAKIDDENL
jgi:hypothetical protein